MKVWFKIQSTNRSFFKQALIQNHRDILLFIQSLSALTKFNKKIEQMQSLGEVFIELVDHEADRISIQLKNIYPSADLTAIIFPCKKIYDQKALPRLLFQKNLLGKQKFKITQASAGVPISKLVNEANILSTILQVSKQKESKNISKRSQILCIKDGIYIQLINNEIGLKILNKERLNQPSFKNQYQQLYEYFDNKFDQLIMEKDLSIVKFYILSSSFIDFKQPESLTSIKLETAVNSKIYFYALFNYFDQNKKVFWPYQQLPLMSILDLCFLIIEKTQFKLSIHFSQEDKTIQKLQVTPLLRFSDTALGRNFQLLMYSCSQSESGHNFKFKGQIFEILQNSKQETKKYYRIPNLNLNQKSNNFQPKITLEDLIEIMSSIGFKINEISSIIKNFSLIINLGLLEIHQNCSTRQRKDYKQVKFIENETLKNIRFLYTDQVQLIQYLILGEPNPKGQYIQTKQETLLKKEVFMRIFWQQCINKFATKLNEILQNKNQNFTKTKKFQIYCHSNSDFENSQLNQKIFIQDGSLHQFQYKILGSKIVEKEFILEQIEKCKDKNSILNQYNNETFDNPEQLRNTFQRQYFQHQQKQFTSFNQKILQQTRKYNQLNIKLKALPRTKQIIKQIFDFDQIEDSYHKFFNIFYKKQLKENITQNNYLICSDYWRFVQQEKQGPNVIKFVIKLIKETINHAESSEPSHYLQIKAQTETGVQTPNRTKLNHFIHLTTPKKGKFFFLTFPKQKENSLSLQSHEQRDVFQTSVTKSLKREMVRVDLAVFIRNYLYGQELKKVHNFFRELQGGSKPRVFRIKDVWEAMQCNMIELHNFNDPISNKNLQKLKDLSQNQQKSVKKLPNFTIKLDLIEKKNYLFLNQSLFQKIKIQLYLQKISTTKIINLFRKFKWKKNHQNYFFRKYFLLQIYKICKFRLFAISLFNKLEKKSLNLTKKALLNINLMYSLQLLNLKAKPIFKSTRKNKIKESFQKLTEFMNKKRSAGRLAELLQKRVVFEIKKYFSALMMEQYQLYVTTPGGNKMNMANLSIESNNVNKPNVTNHGNIYTNNNKNSFTHNKGAVEVFKKSENSSELQSSESPQKNKLTLLKNQNQTILKQSNNFQLDSQLQKVVETKPDPSKQQQNRKTNFKNCENLHQKVGLNSEIKEQKPQKTDSKPQASEVQQSNEIVFALNSALSGSLVSCKSEMFEKLTKEQIFQLKDDPFFSFEAWAKQVNAKFSQKQSNPFPLLFNKVQQQKQINKFLTKEIEVDQIIEQKILNSSFVNYLKENLRLKNDKTVQKVFYFQKKTIDQSMLKHYNQKKLNNTFKEMFNCILKISLFKNSSKKLFELLNIIIKPIKQQQKKQKNTQQTVFNDEPLMNASYDLNYNVLRDEMFLQFAKQIMGNDNKQSLISIAFALEIITKNYYPSMKLFYPFLNHIKTYDINKSGLLSKVYENLLRFSQAIEGYKGATVKIYKGQTLNYTQNEHNSYLQIRQSLFFHEECQIPKYCVKVELPNRETFELQVANETIRTVKKRFVNQLGCFPQQKNFGFYEQSSPGNQILLDQKQKMIDYLSKFYSGKQSAKKIELRIKHYYPIKFKDINSMRMFYLNMINQEIRLPFKTDQYENIVALSVYFDEFQEDRISNYITISNKQKLLDQDLIDIKNKLNQLTNSNAQNKICQFQYFKAMKQSHFLLAKAYKSNPEKLFLNELDRILIKPKQIRMYSGTCMKSSISLYRIKSFYFESNQIHIDLVYSNRDLSDSNDKKFHGIVKNLVISDFQRIKQLYDDIVYYSELLQLGQNF